MTSDPSPNETEELNPQATGYASTWLTPDDLDTLNRRIHDGAPLEALLERARGYRDWLFDTYPAARPTEGSRVMELGSGVGWIMEAMLERFPCKQITGLDISANMIEKAKERFTDPRADFVLYDGFQMPFEDGRFDVAYSVAALQHVEKHVAFLLFEELYRVIAPGGHCMIQLLSVDHIPGSTPNYHDECLNHVRNVPTHWHHYYAFDELFVLFSEVIGVSDFDISAPPGSTSLLIHFSKGTPNRFVHPELPGQRSTRRETEPAEPAPPAALSGRLRNLVGRLTH